MGYAVGVNSAGVDTLEPQHSDVVCFESHADESDSQRHQAIMLNNSVEGAFPPNTLFRLRSVKEDRFIAPTGVEVRQRLLTVSATYRPSRQIGETWGKNGGPRLCGSVVTLLYESRAAFVKGMDDVLGRPMLTMAQECSRPDRFVDWRGVAHTLLLVESDATVEGLPLFTPSQVTDAQEGQAAAGKAAPAGKRAADTAPAGNSKGKKSKA